MVKVTLLIILLFGSVTLAAQHPVPESTNNGNDVYGNLENNQIKDIYELYSLKIDPAYELINGRVYLSYYHLSNSKPILFIDKKHSSSITLNGRKFDDINLEYDTYSDEVINLDSTRAFIYTPFRVALNKDNVNSFELCFVDDTMSFRYFSKLENSGFDLQDGFYEVVYDRDCNYLIKHKSIIQGRTGYDDYLYKPVSYVNAGDGFVKIKSTKQFIKLFGESSGLMRKLIKESGINIRRADKRQIAKALGLYDNLINQIY